MINTFVYTSKKDFFKILSKYLDKEYKENINTLTLNIETEEFNKLIQLFNPQKTTYETIVFYTKNSEPIKELVSSNFNIFIFGSHEELEQETKTIKNRDIEIINNYLNSKAILKNPNLKPTIEEIVSYIEKFPKLTIQDSIMLNCRYREIITLLSLVSIKSNLILLDSDTEKTNNIIIEYPLSVISEIIDLPNEEAQEFLKLYNINTEISEKIKEIIETIIKIILNHWTIFYTGNKKEVKQYLVPHNTDVLTASSKIHTDIAKKFIQAEVCNISEMKDNKLPPFKTFGKTYIVQNHDYVSIKTS
ncbi:MAG: DUF933 domain-containing protein [Candidatus Calescibacterium sp.]|nr:DUF933 domain-containing protein [Candidatus Calescibacterium sp.]